MSWKLHRPSLTAVRASASTHSHRARKSRFGISFFSFDMACLLLRRAGAGRRLLGSRADVPRTAMAIIVYYYITISTACATRAAHVRAEG